MMIYCCGCVADIHARLTDGKEIYPHRKDLHDLPYWKCDTCGNYVGCHYKTHNRTRPLGNIPTYELKQARQHIHRILDPIWKKGRLKRGEVYLAVSGKIGRPYHTAEIKTLDEAREVFRAVRAISKECGL